jgi:hypothetical protein
VKLSNVEIEMIKAGIVILIPPFDNLLLKSSLIDQNSQLIRLHEDPAAGNSFIASLFFQCTVGH